MCYDLVVQSADGVTIKGCLYAQGNDDVVIYCHRLLGGQNEEEADLLLQSFGGRYDLLTFNFRGHRTSLGTTTAGGDEVLDLRAMISIARGKGYNRIFVIGTGMGGTVGVRAAELFGNVDALVVLSPSGFSPRLLPLPVKVLSDITLDSVFGKLPVRILTKTRLGSRYLAGFPVDSERRGTSVPVLILHSEDDRFVKLTRMKDIFEGALEPKEVLIVPGDKHAEDLFDENTLQTIKEYFEHVPGRQQIDPGFPAKRDVFTTAPESLQIEIVGHAPLPVEVIKDELSARLSALAHDRHSRGPIKQQIEDILALHGYNKASVFFASDGPRSRLHVQSPKVNELSIKGNRWVKDDYIKNLLRISNDYYNSYELDQSKRRLAAQPAIKTVKSRIIERPDGDIDIELNVVEQKPYRLLLSTKFTDIDKYFGLGATWNEFNPPAFQYEARAMFGASGHDFLTYLCAGKSVISNSLRFNASFFDMIKSRDDLEYIFSRQEVREFGGEFSAQYKLTASSSVDVSLFEKRYSAPDINQELPVVEGTADGVKLKLDLEGALPLQGAPRFKWKHTFFYQKTGPAEFGDFFFSTYQLNFAGEMDVLRSHKTRTSFHAGWMSGTAPPQELFSLGGMTTLPGYADDSFVNSRVVLAAQKVYLHAGNWLDPTSVWHPTRLILAFHAGEVFGEGEKFRASNLRMDAGFEVDYMETLRFGVVWPVGPLRGDTPRVYAGWGVHVF